jgi:RNAse (barnase) inhibitor barstar
MAIFGTDDLMSDRLDWLTLLSGPVSMYWREAYLDEDVQWFRDNGYRVDSVDASQWDTEAQMHVDLARALDFPNYYGANIDAFTDCLFDLEIPEEGGRVVVFRHYEVAVARFPRVAQQLLDITAWQARKHLLFGLRLIALVQTDDVRIDLAPVGAIAPSWNRRECFNKDRGL